MRCRHRDTTPKMHFPCLSPVVCGMRPDGFARDGQSDEAAGGTRTRDLQVGNLALYQLSYGRTPDRLLPGYLGDGS